MVPERDLRIGHGHLVARDPEQGVALLDDTLELARLAAMGAIDLREHRVEEATASARGGTEQVDVLWEERDHHELAGGLVRALSGTIEEIASRPSALPFGGREEHELHAPVPLRPIDLDAHARAVHPPADELGVVLRAWGFPAGREVDRLE